MKPNHFRSPRIEKRHFDRPPLFHMNSQIVCKNPRGIAMKIEILVATTERGERERESFEYEEEETATECAFGTTGSFPL